MAERCDLPVLLAQSMVFGRASTNAKGSLHPSTKGLRLDVPQLLTIPMDQHHSQAQLFRRLLEFAQH